MYFCVANQMSVNAHYVRICIAGFELEAAGEVVTARKLALKAGVPRMTALRAWRRRDELKLSGCIRRRLRSGRPKVDAFATAADVERSIDLMEDLDMGFHLPDAAAELNCSIATVKRHTTKLVRWRKPEDRDAKGSEPRVLRIRSAYAIPNLTPTGQLSKKLSTATFIDHKWVHAFGINKSQDRQCRRLGSNKPLRPKLKQQYAPKVQGCFMASKFTTEVHIHAKEIDFVRKKGTHLEHEKVNGETLVAAATTTLIPAILKTPSRLVVFDCVNVNHMKIVVAAFEAAGIKVYPSGGHPHNIIGGYPPYSHDVSPLDCTLFRPFQHQMGLFYRKLVGGEGESEEGARGHMCVMSDEIVRLWRSRKYRVMAKKAVAHQKKVLSDIVESGGAQTRR